MKDLVISILIIVLIGTGMLTKIVNDKNTKRSWGCDCKETRKESN